MPTLQFKGKNILWNHHLSVPYHALEDVEKLSYKPEKADGNLIIEGDNLLALKALLPLYAGQIKCIYIDPPYNTGNEGWEYNDNVNSPLMKDWLGKEVGKDDLTRHDKWLCMMTPRLKLLRDLLTEDGVIFISIDDNELYNLKMLMDEIFGEGNFVSCIVCQLNPRGRTLDKFIAKTHEYLLLYAKNYSKDDIINLLEKEGKPVEEYSKKDEKGAYRELELRNRNPVFNRNNRPNLYFPIYIDPDSGKVSVKKDDVFREIALPRNAQSKDGCWTWNVEKVTKNLDILIGKQVSTGAWRVYRKDYLYDDSGEIAKTKAKALWTDKEINNENGKEIVRELFGESPFDFPKSVELIKKIIQLGTSDNSIVLDSFAGSGTTAHALLDLNNEDGGNRKFILVQMTEATPDEPAKNVCKDITRERVIRAIEKFGYNSGFEYMRVGKPMDAESLLSGNLPAVESFGRYVYFLCTGEKITKPVKKVASNLYHIGAQGNADIYLLYSQEYDELTRLALNLDAAEKIGASSQKRTIVYAPACFLDEDYLRAKGIEFVNIPYGLFQRKGNEA